MLLSVEKDNVRYFSRYNLLSYTKDTFYKELQNEFDRTMESIEKYGGFYIGRYETGNLSSVTPVVKRLNTAIGNQSWYNMYLKMKNISNNKNVQTNMILGCLFDETLQWLIDTDEKTWKEVAQDSTSWGNYYNVSFSYTNTSGTLETKVQYSSTRIPTGSTERNRANNIYDLAGNVFEFTTEVYLGGYRYVRAGSYNNTSGANGPVSRRGHVGTDTASDGIGFRSYLYIK